MRLNDEGMQPMRIVSSNQSHEGLCGAGVMGTRIIIFLMGVMVAVAAIVLVAVTVPSERPSTPAEKYEIYLNLQENESYALSVTSSGSVELTLANGTVSTSPFSSAVAYQVHKLCDASADSAWTRFAIVNASQISSIVPAPPSLAADATTVRSFHAMLEDVITNHTFTARLFFDGSQSSPADTANIAATFNHAVRTFAHENPLAGGSGPVGGWSEQQLGMLKSSAVSVAATLVDTIMQFLQAVPIARANESTGDSWVRHRVERGIAYDVHYKLRDVTPSDLILINETAFSQASTSVSPRDTAHWLVESSASVKLDGSTNVTGALTAAAADYFPPDVAAFFRLSNASTLETSVRGLAVLGAQTGVVLHSRELFTVRMHLEGSMLAPQGAAQLAGAQVAAATETPLNLTIITTSRVAAEGRVCEHTGLLGPCAL